MRLKNHLISEGFLGNMLKTLIKKPASNAMKEIKNGFQNFFGLVKKIPDDDLVDILQLVNKATGSNYRSVKDLEKVARHRLKEDFEINEDFKHWWKEIREQGWFNITFFPALQVWFEIANILQKAFQGESIDATTIKKAAFYGVLWLALASGKFIKDFYKWKKQNPKAYKQERGLDKQEGPMNIYT